MKKDLIFAPILLAIGILLGLLKVTGLAAHIAISLVGVALLVVYAVLTKKEWKIPALEIAMRACYGVALITGIVVMKAAGVAVLAVMHKLFAMAFIVLLVALFAQKLVTSKK